MPNSFDTMPGHLVRRAQQVSSAIFADVMTREGIDITPFQFAALSAIAMHPGTDQAGVATQAAIDRATVGGVIDRLVEKGFVARTVSKADRRARVLTLTPEGEAILARTHRAAERVQEALTAGLDADEREVLGDLLARVARNHPKADTP